MAAAFRDVGLALGTTGELDDVLDLILAKIRDTLEADRATLYVLDEQSGELISQIVLGSEVRDIRLRVGDGIAGYVAETGKTLRIKDAYKHARFDPQWDKLSGYRTRSMLVTPMRNHVGRIIGVIQIINKASGEFTPSDVTLLGALATHAAVTIDNSRLFLSVLEKNKQLFEIKEQLERRVADLRLLFSLESAMARAHTVDDLFAAVLGEAMHTGGATSAAAAVRHHTGQITLYVVDDKRPQLRKFPLDDGQGLIGQAVANNAIVVSKDARRDPRTDPKLDRKIGMVCKTALAVPLEGDDDRSLGAIALYNKKGKESAFDDEDRAMLSLIAANASTALRLQLAREARERGERLGTIGRLLSSILHDLKTPLSVVGGYVQLMSEESSLVQRRQYAERILRQFDHIRAMQREILEFARGERSLLVRKVYLARFAEEIRHQLEPELREAGIELELDVRDTGTARFDETKLLRVVHNLARNAMEAMARQGGGKFSVRISIEKRTSDLVLRFADTGPGIPPAIRHRVFETFVTSGKQGGTGLGLTIVKKIVEEHHGTVALGNSKQGAVFVCRLPQGRDAKALPAPPRRGSHVASRSNGGPSRSRSSRASASKGSKSSAEGRRATRATKTADRSRRSSA